MSWRLGHSFERLNLREADSMRRSVPADRPPLPLVTLAELARGGALWLAIAVVLALRPGRLRSAARDGAVAVALASASAHLVSRALPRPRPRAEALPARQALPHSPRSPSFPSAHATVASAFITAVTRRSRPAGLAILPVAAAVAYSRVRTRVHWPTDVAAGATQGVLVGAAVHRLFSRAR